MGQRSGIFLVNKPRGISTNHLIQRIKHRLKIKKIGHAGTLDPLAQGLVVVLVNQATKLSSFLISEAKEYLATIKLFIATSTLDQEGEVIAKELPFTLHESDLRNLSAQFNGYEYEQQTPLFSAVKVQGQKLYEYARKHELVTTPLRKVVIKKFSLENYDASHHTLQIRTVVSKGTYIRTLAQDVARHLGTIGHLEQLTRIGSGNFKIDQAKTAETLGWNDLINLYDALTLAGYPILIFEGPLSDIAYGKPILLPPDTPPKVFLANAQKEILAHYGLGQDHFYHCLRGGFNNH